MISSLSSSDQALASAGLQVGVAMDEYAEEHERGDFLVRGILGLDKARGAIAIGDIVPVGRTVRFQVRDAASADDDLRAMLIQLAARVHCCRRRAAVFLQRQGIQLVHLR